MSEWSVLVTAAQRPGSRPISTEERAALLTALPGDDKWIQYPPASGRGHGFETRFWWEAEPGADAATAGADALERYVAAVAEIGTIEIDLTFIHVTTAGERLTEGPIGLERRVTLQDPRTWHIMLRSISTASSVDAMFPDDRLDDLLKRLGPDSSGHARKGMVEVRFWIEAGDAVEASAIGSGLFKRAMIALGRPDWLVVRDHVTSVAEAARVAYLGVERRVLEVDPRTLPVRLNPASR
jgi:hypothetical protein